MAGVLARRDCLTCLRLIFIEPGRLAPPARLAYVSAMKDLTVGVLTLFAEAQAVARAITDEKHGNLRAHYLLVKREDNAERWKATASNKAKRDARNARRRRLYKPKERKPVDHKATRRAYYAKVKDKLNEDRRAKYDPESRSARHQRTGH